MRRTPPSSKRRPTTLAPRALDRLIERSLRQGAEALYRDPLLYDHLYVKRNDDIEFYVKMARRYSGPVLEIGVGTGRVAVALANAGFAVTGVDAMTSMLRQARARIAELPAPVQARIVLHRADMRRLALGQRYPLVIAPFNAFAHLYSRSDVERALAACRLHLRPGGRLIFDVIMPDLAALMQDPSRLYRCADVVDPNSGKRFAYSEASHYDPERQVRSMTLQLSHKTGKPRPRAIPLTHRQFFPAELAALLHYNGFAIEERFGDFSQGPLTERSETQVIVARCVKAGIGV